MKNVTCRLCSVIFILLSNTSYAGSMPVFDAGFLKPQENIATWDHGLHIQRLEPPADKGLSVNRLKSYLEQSLRQSQRNNPNEKEDSGHRQANSQQAFDHFQSGSDSDRKLINDSGDEHGVPRQPIIHLYVNDNEKLLYWDTLGTLRLVSPEDCNGCQYCTEHEWIQWQDLRLGWQSREEQRFQADVYESGEFSALLENNEPDPLLDFLTVICMKGRIAGRYIRSNGEKNYIYVDINGQSHSITQTKLKEIYSYYYEQQLEVELEGGLPAGGGVAPEAWRADNRVVPWTVLHRLARLSGEKDVDTAITGRKLIRPARTDPATVIPPIISFADNPSKQGTRLFGPRKTASSKKKSLNDHVPDKSGDKSGDKSASRTPSGSQRSESEQRTASKMATNLSALTVEIKSGDHPGCHECGHYIFYATVNYTDKKLTLDCRSFQGQDDGFRRCFMCYKNQKQESAFYDVRQSKDLASDIKNGSTILYWHEHQLTLPDFNPRTRNLKLELNLSGLLSDTDTLSILMGNLKRVAEEHLYLKNAVEAHEKKIQDQEKKIEDQAAIIDALKKQQPQQKERTNDPRGDDGATSRLSRKLNELQKTVTNLVVDYDQSKNVAARMTRNIDELSAVLTKQESCFDELNLKLEILEVKSCTGCYLWKINDLTRRKNEAKLGHTLSLYSPPFYTSEHGYRVCLRCYLNGDGSGRDTHISLYIVVMKGEFDALLAWPFSHQVTLTLVNQVKPLDAKQSITHEFTPSPSSSSFQKPKEVFNIASGFPEFAPVTVLSNPRFTSGDTLYFRIKLKQPNKDTGPDEVDFGNK